MLVNIIKKWNSLQSLLMLINLFYLQYKWFRWSVRLPWTAVCQKEISKKISFWFFDMLFNVHDVRIPFSSYSYCLVVSVFVAPFQYLNKHVVVDWKHPRQSTRSKLIVFVKVCIFAVRVDCRTKFLCSRQPKILLFDLWWNPLKTYVVRTCFETKKQ